MFGKKETLIGLDIGSHSIKMVQMEMKESTLRLLNLGLVPVPGDAYSEGGFKKPELVTDAIRQLVSHLKIKDKYVAASISGFEVMIKKVDLPMMTEEELDKRMQAELGQFIPYNLEEVDVDYQILDVAKDRPNYMDVLLVAAKKESINDYVNMIRRAGLDPMVIDVDFFALGNAFEASYGLSEQNIALLDLGANKAILSIVHRGTPLFTRGISIGGSQITDRIREHFRISQDEAERVKLGIGSEKFAVEELEEVFVSVVKTWVNEFKRAINFYYSNFPENKIEKVYVSGGSSRIPGLDKVFQENADGDVEVEIFDPLAKVAYDQQVFDSTYLGYIGPQMAIALGLALRKTKK